MSLPVLVSKKCLSGALWQLKVSIVSCMFSFEQFTLMGAMKFYIYEVMFKKRAAVFYRGLKTRGVAECFYAR